MRRFHDMATETLPHDLSRRRTMQALADSLTPEAWIMAATGLGPCQQGLRGEPSLYVLVRLRRGRVRGYLAR